MTAAGFLLWDSAVFSVFWGEYAAFLNEKLRCSASMAKDFTLVVISWVRCLMVQR